MDITTLHFVLSAAICICIFAVLYFLYRVAISQPVPEICRFEPEYYFFDSIVDPPIKCRFPSIHDSPVLDLSIIIPAYNEEVRLSGMLDECISFLEERSKANPNFLYEVIVVDDGSCDRTTDVAMKYSKSIGSEKFRVLTLMKNRGKGGAVRLGMLSARGKYLLFADADGATKFSDLNKLEEKMAVLNSDYENIIIIGSRAHLEKQAIATRSAFRTFLMYGFHMLVWLFGVRGIRDTQCGFKLFTRESAKHLFTYLHVERWAFDVEILYLASRLKMQVNEVPVNWTEIEGSKLVPFWSWMQMGKDLLLIWFRYQIGVWKVPQRQKIN